MTISKNCLKLPRRYRANVHRCVYTQRHILISELLGSAESRLLLYTARILDVVLNELRYLCSHESKRKTESFNKRRSGQSAVCGRSKQPNDSITTYVSMTFYDKLRHSRRPRLIFVSWYCYTISTVPHLHFSKPHCTSLFSFLPFCGNAPNRAR